MGLKRFIWRHTPEGALIDTIRSAVKEKSLIGGLKRMENEKWKEDNPVTSAIYKSGKYDGKKEVWGGRIFEKCGIGRDEGGDGGKTLEIRGKRRLSARDGGANYQQS